MIKKHPIWVGKVDNILHPWVKRAARLARDREFRQKTGKILLGGHKIVWEFWKRPNLNDGTQLAVTTKYLERHKQVFKDQPWMLHRCLKISDACVKYITREAAPEGILLEAVRPTWNQFNFESNRILVLMSPSLPQNMGPLFRTAAAFGWSPIILVGPSTDPYSYEAIRTSKGATLRIPFKKVFNEGLLKLLNENRYEPIVALNTLDTGIIPTELNQNWEGRRIALILGNEANGIDGLSSSILDSAHKISLPTSKLVQSLNVSVAGGILMYLLRSWESSKEKKKPLTTSTL